MHKLKRIGAFLLSMVICLQVMSFTVFANISENGFSITGKEFISKLDSSTNSNLSSLLFMENIENGEKVYTTLINGCLIVGYSVDQNTNKMKAFFSVLDMSKSTDKDIENFAVFLAQSTKILDPSVNIDKLIEELKLNDFLTQQVLEYEHDNILYSKDVDGEYVGLYIMELTKEPVKMEQENPKISVVVDDKPLSLDIAPQNINGRTMVPVRGIFEALGATVTWNPETKQVIATKDSTKVTLTLNDTTAYINGEPKTLESPAIIYQGSTLVPTRFVAEAFGADVNWNADTKTVVITSAGTATIKEEPKQTTTVQPQQTTVVKETPKQTVTETPKTDMTQNRTVYITKTGKRYHYSGTCNGGTYYPSTLQEAKARGLTPCNKCA